MNVQYSFKHMEASQALKEHTDSRLQDLMEKFLSKAGHAHVTFAVEKHNHVASCHVSGGEGVQFQVDHTSEDMYQSVERMLEKLSSQMKKHKEKLKDHKGHTSLGDLAPDVLSKEDQEFENVSIDASDIKALEKKSKK